MAEQTDQNIQKPLPEHRFQRELDALAAHDERPKPAGWNLSPRAVADFVTGLDEPLEHPDGEPVEVRRKFYGNDPLVERAIISLSTERGLMLVGEPGTAKSMLAGLLAAAVSGDSTLTIQGSAGTTEDQVTYGWNYAALLAEGPSEKALVPAPVYRGMRAGKLVRFEEITRCVPEVQDVLLSAMSERLLVIGELTGDARLVHAQSGFNIIATANTRDRGVNDMSAALKRRFNFETVEPIANLSLEVDLVRTQTNQRLADAEVPTRLDRDVAELLVQTFQELRAGLTDQGDRVDRPTTPMSTAEAVDVAYSSALHAYHYGSGDIEPAHVVRHMVGTVLKDDPDDRERLRNYFERVVRRRAQSDPRWKKWGEAKRWL